MHGQPHIRFTPSCPGAEDSSPLTWSERCGW